MQVTPSLGVGGVERATLDVAAAVADAGAGSLVASRGGALEGDLAEGGARLVRLPLHSRNPLVMAACAGRLGRVIVRERVSLVHVRSRAPAFAALFAARRAGVPVVATYHGIYSAGSAAKRWYNAVMTRGDLVIANSVFTRDHVMAEHGLAPERIALVREGVDTARFDPAAVSPTRRAAVRARFGLDAGSRTPVILLAARLADWKGHGLAIEAMAGLAGRRDALLVLVGEEGDNPAYAAALRAAAERAGLSRRVRWVGAGDDMPALFAAADLVIAPSTRPESFGRSVAEAAAMGRPALASRLGAHGEAIEDGVTGWLVPPSDPRAWAQALDRALDTDADTLRAMGEAARARAEAIFSLAAMNAATFAVYRRVLEARP